MSPRPSNREVLVEAALDCLERQGYAAVRTRDIAVAAGANLASIGYHFGSKDALLCQALRLGFGRWFDEVAAAVPDVVAGSPRVWLAELVAALRSSLDRHRNFALAFLEAAARAPRDAELRASLAESYRQARTDIAVLLGLADDEAGRSVASLLLSIFDGLLFQWMIDPPAMPGENALMAGMDHLEARLAEPRTQP